MVAQCNFCWVSGKIDFGGLLPRCLLRVDKENDILIVEETILLSSKAIHYTCNKIKTPPGVNAA
jgi:hypothetical protein